MPSSGGAVSAPPMPSWATGQDAAAPPAIASSTGLDTSPSGGTFVQPKPFAASPGGRQQSSAVAGGALEDDNESCVVCMSAPVQAGFLHGSRSVPCTRIVASSSSVIAVVWSRSSSSRGVNAHKEPYRCGQLFLGMLCAKQSLQVTD